MLLLFVLSLFCLFLTSIYSKRRKHNTSKIGIACKCWNKFRIVYTFHSVAFAAIAQWVRRPTEKPCAVLTRVRVPCAARNSSPKANFWDSA